MTAKRAPAELLDGARQDGLLLRQSWQGSFWLVVLTSQPQKKSGKQRWHSYWRQARRYIGSLMPQS